MSNLLDTVFLPGLYLNRDKNVIAQIEDLLLHQESCTTVCMWGNGKDYMFTNVVERLRVKKPTHKLKVLNTISADELRDFADMLINETEPTLCLVNIRVRKDVSWFMQIIDDLRVKRGYGFVSYVSAYVGDVYQALHALNISSLIILKKVDYKDSLHIIKELSDRFEFVPSEEQKRDIYKWSYGHVGLLRTLFLLKRQSPGKAFSAEGLLREPTVLERLNNIIHDLPAEKFDAIKNQQLSFVEKVFFEEFGYINADGELFHPLLLHLVPKRLSEKQSALSATENRVLDYLRKHQGKTVSRDDIAKIVWGDEEWEDKFSDWAIGQLIYRLRKKLAYSATAGAIQTLKGEGFAFTQKTGVRTPDEPNTEKSR